MLELSGNIIQLSIFDQPGSGLMIGKADIIIQALPVKIQYPVEVTGTGVRAGFAADSDRFDLPRIVLEVWTKIYGRQHGLDHNRLMPDGKRKIDGEPMVCRPLILTGHSNPDMVPAVFPVRW